MSYSNLEKEGNRVFLRSGLRPRIAFPALLLMSLVSACAAGISFSGGLLPPHGFIFAGVALLLFFGALLYRSGRALRPRSLEFNNDAGDVLVLEDEPTPRGVIPYGRIRSFLIRRKSRGRWTVFMVMKDGAYWDLAEFALRRTAASFQGRLARNVRLRTRDSLKLPPLPERITVEKQTGGANIRWRENLSFRTFLTASGLLPGLLLVIAGLVTQARPDLMRTYWTWAAGIAAALQVLFVFMAIRLRASEHGIIIDENRITHFVGSADKKETNKDGSFAERGDVHRVQYSFDPDHGLPKLLFLNREQAERLDRLRVGDVRLREIPRMFWMERKIFKIPLTGLRASEAEALRAHVEKILGRREEKPRKR